GRPSMGPVSPVRPPTKAGSTGCCVWLDIACGAGFKVDTALRASTSKRGIGWVNGWTPNVGLAGSPVGIPILSNWVARIALLGVLVCAAVWPYADLTNGFKPPIGSIMPALVNKPHLTRSRRLIWPWDSALVISARFRRAFSASRIRLLSECSDNQILSSRSFRDMLALLFRESLVVRLRFTRRSLAGRLKNLFRAGHN